MRRLGTILLIMLFGPTIAVAQEKRDSLEAAVFVSRQAGNYISRGKTIRTEVVSSSGLQKMACCSLADSFENSASVSVGYSDAVTGARQIRLLGLSGTYTQMLDEARPVMRGLSSPFGLNYVPGQWLESIQIAKGASSVVSGSESITGSINMEHRKPTDEVPLFVNASLMGDTKTDLNIVSSQQFGERWSTVLFGHVSGNFQVMDMNGDGFADDPKQLQFNLGNRWLYFGPDLRVRFGVHVVKDDRRGGTIDSKGNPSGVNPWISDISNRNLNSYLKVARPLENGSVALVADYSFQKMDSSFGVSDAFSTLYNATQHSAYLNLMYQGNFGESHSVAAGASGFADFYDETFRRGMSDAGRAYLANGGLYGEYTFRSGDVFTLIAGLRADYYKDNGVKVVPRVNLKYAPIADLVFRASSGRGLKFSNPLVDNIGVFSTNKTFAGDFRSRTLEDAWISGANLTWYFGGTGNSLSFDYFHTGFNEQMIVDYGASSIDFYNMTSLDGGRCFTDTYQVDLAFEPLERLSVNTTFRYTDARITLKNEGLVEKPMTSRYKGVVNVQYALPLNKWIFDFTASVNGPCRLYQFMDDDYSPAYPLLYAQVTKRMKGWDLYLGSENITGFRQNTVILGDRMSGDFDASCVWGPVMGRKIYAGIRITIWKTV